MRPSSSSHSQSFSNFESDNANHFFSPIQSTSPSLLQYASNSAYYGCSTSTSSSSFPSVALSNPTYESVGQSGLVTTASMASTVSTTEGGGGILSNEAVISKSSSSDSDTNDSATRLISDSLADITNQHIYLMQNASAVDTSATEDNNSTNAQYIDAQSKVNKPFQLINSFFQKLPYFLSFTEYSFKLRFSKC